ncbi:hypothetical protein GJ699_33705 [Duganella sp. FT80W]|uniref:Uncharacterized protein n=1 Tax=Duganella guangzhouensis TaxID=2666084 RepID=A0A6I2L9G7_9BURK|nr:hypothetical protein [Duganella guangzhouensis]MRW94915.1 hypothetical protein [Duganella guangzhouensis]
MTQPQDKPLDAETGLDEATLDGVVGGAQASVKNDGDDSTKQADGDGRFASDRMLNDRLANDRLASERFFKE